MCFFPSLHSISVSISHPLAHLLLVFHSRFANEIAFSEPWLRIGYAFIPIFAHHLRIIEWNVEYNESVAKWIAEQQQQQQQNPCSLLYLAKINRKCAKFTLAQNLHFSIGFAQYLSWMENTFVSSKFWDIRLMTHSLTWIDTLLANWPYEIDSVFVCPCVCQRDGKLHRLQNTEEAFM